MSAVSWPAAVFDDDTYPYVLTSQQDLRSWAESEHTADEFTAGFDSAGHALHLVFGDGEPSLIVAGDGDVDAFRSLTRTALAEHGGMSGDAVGDLRVMGFAELIAALRSVR